MGNTLPQAIFTYCFLFLPARDRVIRCTEMLLYIYIYIYIYIIHIYTYIVYILHTDILYLYLS